MLSPAPFVCDFRQTASGSCRRHFCSTQALPVPPPWQPEDGGKPGNSLRRRPPMPNQQVVTYKTHPVLCSGQCATAPPPPPSTSPPFRSGAARWGQTQATLPRYLQTGTPAIHVKHLPPPPIHPTSRHQAPLPSLSPRPLTPLEDKSPAAPTLLRWGFLVMS